MTIKVLAWPKCKNRKNNPFQALLYSAIEQTREVVVDEFSLKSFIFLKSNSILHIHWPDVFLATANGSKFWLKLFFLRLLFNLARIKKVHIVWTAHNLKRDGQQNAARLERLFWPWFSKIVGGIIYMTQASKATAETYFPHWKTLPNAVIPHGHYQPIFHEFESYRQSKNSNIPEIVFFGSITKYKNANKLLQAYLDLPIASSTLTIKGKMSQVSPDNALLTVLRNLPEKYKEYVTFENRFLGDDELVELISSADLVVFPYSDVLNSGAAIFALSLGKPILASNTSLFRELQQLVGKHWVMLIDGELDGDQLQRAVQKAKRIKEDGEKPDLSHLEWDVIAKHTIVFYRRCIEEGM